MSQRQEKVEQQLQAHIATFIMQEANTNPLITVTHIEASPDFKNATVYFTTIPETGQDNARGGIQKACEQSLKRLGTEVRTYVKNKMSMKAIPHFDFAVDYGERHRQHIDEIVRETGTAPSEYLGEK